MGDAVTAGEYTGPAHNSVSSSNGKVQIRNFEVFWTSTEADTVIDKRNWKLDNWYKPISKFNNEPKMQINWALSGEIQYPKGAMTITIPDMQFEDENDLKYPFGSYSIPKAKFKKDGFIDFSANYGNATLAYYYDKEEKATKLINILDLAPGASGTFTLTYGDYAGNSRWLKDMSIHKTKPIIDLKYKNETLKTQDKTLKIQQNTTLYANVYKIGTLFKTWQDNWGDKFKPKNPEDYWYVCYQIEMDFYDFIQTNLDYKLTDSLGNIEEYSSHGSLDYGKYPEKIIKDKQEIIAYSDIGKEKINYTNPSKSDGYIGRQFAITDFSNKPKSKDKIEWPIENFNLKKNEIKNLTNYWRTKKRYAYVLVKIPAKKLGYMEEKKSYYVKADNNVKLEVVPKNSNSNKKEYDGSASVKDFHTYAPDVKFDAPPGDMFTLEKVAKHTHGITYYNYEWQEMKSDGFDVDNSRYYKDIWCEYSQNEELYKDRDVSWRVMGSARVANATHDSKYDNQENPSDAYGKKKIKYELVDDYLYLADDYTKELTPEDYTVKSIEFGYYTLNLYDYKQPNKKYKADYIDAYKDDIIIPASLYIRKTSTSKWEKAATFDMETKYFKDSGSKRMNVENFKGHMEGVKIGPNRGEGEIFFPKGYTSTKLVYEAPFAGVDLNYQINGILHSSKRVRDYIDNSKDNKYLMNIKLRNDSTFLAYDENGNRLGLQGTTKSSTNVDRTLELDKINYGEEMYHSPVHLYLRQKPMPQMNGYQDLYKSIFSSSNNVSEKQFEIPAEVIYKEGISNSDLYDYKSVRKQFHVQNSGTFYDLLPLGVTGVKDVKIGNNRYLYNKPDRLSYFCYDYYDKETGYNDDGYNLLNSSYNIIPNWRNSGRSLLVARFDNAELSKNLKSAGRLDPPNASIKLSYTMIYPWDSYKDYGSKIERNLVAYESGFKKQANDGLNESLTNELERGYKDSNPGYRKKYNSKTAEYDLDDKIYTDQEIEWMKDLNPNHDEKRFLYSYDSTYVSGDTEANIGLTKHIKDERDSGFKLKTKTREGGHYQYKIRLQAAHATTVSNLVFFDSLENYDPLKADEDYGVKRWRGELESIDVTHPIMKGVDPKIYVSTVPKVDIEKYNDVSDSSIWKLYKEGDDLSKVTGIAVDLRKNKDGSDFKLEQDTAINVYLNMKAPWDMKDKRIDPEAKALNAIFAKHTVSTSLDNKSDKLIYTAYTAIGLEPVETEIQLQANKKHLDQEGKEITLKGDDFTFELRDKDNKLLQTKTNDKDGKITFDSIKYNTWNVGNHQYKIVEKKGNSDTTAYDNHEEVVNVKVERSGDSELKATTTYDEDGANFTNREINPVKAIIKAQKVYYGESGQKEKPKANAFEFILKDSEGKEISKATNDAEGNIVFEEMTFTANQLGKHKYTIEEKQGKDPKIEYDKHKEDVTITVSMTEDYKLQAKVDYTNKDGPIFTNKVKTQLKYLPETGSTIQIFLIGSAILFVIAASIIIIKRKSKVRE